MAGRCSGYVKVSGIGVPIRSKAWRWALVGSVSIGTSALAAANRFLHAWQNQDHETGIVMLADTARQHASPESLQSFFSPGPDAAYEIAHGQRLKAGEYAFPLVLFGSAEGPRPRYCKLLVVHAGKDDWAVERLP